MLIMEKIKAILLQSLISFLRQHYLVQVQWVYLSFQTETPQELFQYEIEITQSKIIFLFLGSQ